MLHLTARQIGLLIMVMGVVSIGFHEPLSRLDLLSARDASHAAQADRLVLARRIILGVGIGCILLAAVVVRAR